MKGARLRGGVRPPHGKHLAWDSPIEAAPTPRAVRIPLLQHAGKAALCLIENARADVRAGELVAAPAGFVSAAVHASVSGTAGQVADVALPWAHAVPALPIDAHPQQPIEGPSLVHDLFGGDWPLDPPDDIEPEALLQAVSDAGIVGHGGAAFPTHVKLMRQSAHPVDTLLVNGCECEPYLTADYRLMLEYPRAVLAGALLAARACGASRIVVAIEDDKPAAVEALGGQARHAGIEVASLRARYPTGNERLAIRAVLGRTIPTGQLPLHVGVVVINVATAAAVARAVRRGKALTHRIVTVSGPGVVRPRNLLAPVGMSYRDLLAACDGQTDGAACVLAGGSMTGHAVVDLDMPITKGTAAVTVLETDDVRDPPRTACIRCGRCSSVCPTRLIPTKLAHAGRLGDTETARRYHIPACIECGCCAYACPAALPLVQWIRAGKRLTAGRSS